MSKVPASKVAGLIAKATPVYHIYVVSCDANGGKYVSVRKNISSTALLNLLVVGSRDANFNQPIHDSIRQYGRNKHVVRLVGSYTSKTEAQVIAAKMIEDNAVKAKALNGTRPKAGASETFVWYSPEDSKAAVKANAKKTRTAKKPVTTTQVSA